MSGKNTIFVLVSLLFVSLFGLARHIGYAATNLDFVGKPCADSSVCGGLTCDSGFCKAMLKEGLEGAGDVFRVLTKIGNYLFAFFMVASLFFTVWAAYLFVSGGGNPARLQEAKQRVVYAVIGIIVALLAVFFDDIIASFIGVSIR
ncbi:MAG: hypothetical protein HYV78_01450 [Candidatus Wildermuthbacteria bacterium]|nr:hypothetical protein [Candidatus Wildermuthbacteria bacterium]